MTTLIFSSHTLHVLHPITKLINIVCNLQYSSKATWYPHVCCRLKILRWRLHHAFSIWTGAHYVCALMQIIRCVHLQTLHPFWMNFLIKLNINRICVHNELMNNVSVCSNQPLNRLSYWKTDRLQLCAVSYDLLFGVKNGSFIGD